MQFWRISIEQFLVYLVAINEAATIVMIIFANNWFNFINATILFISWIDCLINCLIDLYNYFIVDGPVG